MKSRSRLIPTCVKFGLRKSFRNGTVTKLTPVCIHSNYFKNTTHYAQNECALGLSETTSKFHVVAMSVVNFLTTLRTGCRYVLRLIFVPNLTHVGTISLLHIASRQTGKKQI